MHSFMNFLLIAVLWTRCIRMGYSRSLVHPCLTTTIKRAASPRDRGDRKRTCARWRELRSLVHSVAVRTGEGASAIIQRDCPSSGGEAQGYALRLPRQIVCLRRNGQSGGAHKCFATLALVLPFARRRVNQYRVGRRRGAGRPEDCPSSGGKLGAAPFARHSR